MDKFTTISVRRPAFSPLSRLRLPPPTTQSRLFHHPSPQWRRSRRSPTPRSRRTRWWWPPVRPTRRHTMPAAIKQKKREDAAAAAGHPTSPPPKRVARLVTIVTSPPWPTQLQPSYYFTAQQLGPQQQSTSNVTVGHQVSQRGLHRQGVSIALVGGCPFADAGCVSPVLWCSVSVCRNVPTGRYGG